MRNLIYILILSPFLSFAQDQDFEFVTSPDLIEYEDKGYDVEEIITEPMYGYNVEKVNNTIYITNVNFRYQVKVHYMSYKKSQLTYKVIGRGYLVIDTYDETVKFFNDKWLLKKQYGR